MSNNPTVPNLVRCTMETVDKTISDLHPCLFKEITKTAIMFNTYRITNSASLTMECNTLMDHHSVSDVDSKTAYAQLYAYFYTKQIEHPDTSKSNHHTQWWFFLAPYIRKPHIVVVAICNTAMTFYDGVTGQCITVVSISKTIYPKINIYYIDQAVLSAPNQRTMKANDVPDAELSDSENGMV